MFCCGLTLWPTDMQLYLKLILYKLVSKIDFLRNCPQMNATTPHWWLVNIGSGITWNNDQQVLWRNMASLHHELITKWDIKQRWLWCYMTLLCPNGLSGVIDPFHKSQNASVLYPTMQHFITEMCTHVHISVTKCCIVGYLSDALWDLWDGSIACLFHY